MIASTTDVELTLEDKLYARVHNCKDAVLLTLTKPEESEQLIALTADEAEMLARGLKGAIRAMEINAKEEKDD